MTRFVVGVRFDDGFDEGYGWADIDIDADGIAEALELARRDAEEMVWLGKFVDFLDVAVVAEGESRLDVVNRCRLYEKKPPDQFTAVTEGHGHLTPLSPQRLIDVLREPSPEFPLNGLAAVPWSEMQHAFGAADTVPRYLEGLAVADQSWRERSLQFLMSLLAHQSQTGGIFAKCLPFLLTAFGEWSRREWHRADLALVLLYEAISADFELETVHERWRRRKERYGEKLPSIESVVAAEIENRVAVGAAFLAQRETIESFASDPCAETKGHVESLLNIIRDGFLVAKQMQRK